MDASDNTQHSSGYYWGVTALVALTQVVFGVDFGSVNVALATIARELQIAPAILPWVVSTYSLAYAGFLVLGGRAADIYGRRRFCIFGLGLFGVGLLVAILAQNVWMLITARVLEGLGSAFFIPASFSLINVLLPDGPIRHRAFSVFSITQGVAMVLGLCGGGIVTTTFGWRAVFFINLPLVLAAIWLSARFIPAHLTDGRKHSLDVGGAVLITVAAVLALVSLSAMGEYGWLSVQGLGLLGGAFVLLFAFLFLERSIADPLVPPSTYGYTNFMGANLGCVFSMAPTGCCFVLLNLFMQHVLNLTALQSGLGMLPYALAVMTAGRFIGHGMSRYPMRPTILIGFTIFVAGALLFTMVSDHRGYALNIIPGSIVVGLGSTLAAILLMALSTARVPAPVQGVASGVMVTFQQIGLALGVSVGLTVVTASMKAGDAPVVAFQHGFLAAAIMAGLGFVSVLLFTRKTVVANADLAIEKAEAAGPI